MNEKVARDTRWTMQPALGNQNEGLTGRGVIRRHLAGADRARCDQDSRCILCRAEPFVGGVDHGISRLACDIPRDQLQHARTNRHLHI